MGWHKVSPELSELLEKALVSFNCDKRTMFGCPVCQVNNNMFTGIHQDSIFVRLSEQDRQDILSKYDKSRPFQPIEGRIMKEYVVLPEGLRNDPEALQEWLHRSYQYVLSLPPKERKRRTNEKEANRRLDESWKEGYRHESCKAFI